MRLVLDFMRLQLENHSDRPAPYHFVNMDNQKGRKFAFCTLANMDKTVSSLSSANSSVVLLVAAWRNRCVLAGPAHGHHSAGFLHGGHGPLWTNVSDQLPQEGAVFRNGKRSQVTPNLIKLREIHLKKQVSCVIKGSSAPLTLDLLGFVPKWLKLLAQLGLYNPIWITWNSFYHAQNQAHFPKIGIIS